MIYSEDDIKFCDLYAPHFTLAIRDTDDVTQWTPWFKARNIQGFVYAFYYKKHIIKIGCSYCAFQTRKNTSWGDRFVRQFHNLPGRLSPPPKNNDEPYIFLTGYGYVPSSENGREIVEPIQDLEKQLNIKIDRNDIYVYIWNITNATSTKFNWFNDDKDNKRKAEYFEGLLVHQYKINNDGMVPIGNQKHDPSTKNHAFTKAKIAKEVGQLFSF